MENIKNNPETPDNSQLETHENVPTESVEDVVVAIDGAIEHGRTHPETLPDDSFTVLHDRVCHTEVKSVFENYEKHNTLTFDDINESVSLVLSLLKAEIENDPDDEVMKKSFNLLTNRDQEIERAVRRYVQTISRFFHIKKQQFRLDPEDFAAKFQEIDRIRRMAHDGLIDTLVIYTKIVSDMERHGALPGITIQQWSTTRQLEPGDENTVYIFSPDVLANRDLVKDWAVSAYAHKCLTEISQMKKGTQTELGAL